MTITLQATEHKTFAKPEETREFPNGRAEILQVGGAAIGRLSFERTRAKRQRNAHSNVSGQLGIRMDDGTEIVAGPGDITSLPSGHDAWVIGDEPVVTIDWYGATDYARA